MRVVFDTNILVSAFIFPGGQAERALGQALNGVVQMILSKPILHELLGVLARKFARDPEELARVAVFLSELAEVVHPRQQVAVLQDEPDNRILECAVTGHADLIITGDRQMLALGEYAGIPIATLRAFLESTA